jgi:hypothetical protein
LGLFFSFKATVVLWEGKWREYGEYYAVRSFFAQYCYGDLIKEGKMDETRNVYGWDE